MTPVTEKQKQIYNFYLRAYRVNNDQPFRAKKDFSDIETDADKLMSLQKIERVFQKYPAFFNKTFFDAPYKIYDDEKKYYSLKFYASQKGITTCIAYYKMLLQSSPEEQMDHIRESYKFIANYCIEKGIQLKDYTKHCTVAQNDCLLHLKEHKISWYIIFGIPNFYDLLTSLPIDEFELYYGSSVDLSNLYDRYNSSAKTKDFMLKAKSKIAHFVKKKLEQSDAV